MSETSNLYVRRFFIAYHKREKTTWWNFMLRKDFGHCNIYTDIAGGFILLNTSFLGISLHEQYFTEEEIKKLDNVVFQEYIVSEPESNEIRMKGFITCVSVIKSILFIKNWFIITPYQLYKHIERIQNGKPV